jgi:hypothetical protein
VIKRKCCVSPLVQLSYSKILFTQFNHRKASSMQLEAAGAEAAAAAAAELGVAMSIKGAAGLSGVEGTREILRAALQKDEAELRLRHQEAIRRIERDKEKKVRASGFTLAL